MNDSRRSTRSALRILIPLCSVICATAYATGSPAVGAPPAASATVQAPRAPLDLRVPKLRQVMTHSELLADLGPNSGDEESIEVIAAPALVPMSFDSQAPLGIVDSVRWSVDHPTQVWRILLPANVTP